MRAKTQREITAQRDEALREEGQARFDARIQYDVETQRMLEEMEKQEMAAKAAEVASEDEERFESPCYYTTTFLAKSDSGLLSCANRPEHHIEVSSTVTIIINVCF